MTQIPPTDADLQARIDALEAENARLSARLSGQRAAAKTTVGRGVKILLGRPFHRASARLSAALQAWQRGEREAAPLPELVDFSSAAFARFVRVGLVGLLFAILPIAILVVQTVLLLFQNAKLDTQNRLAREQVIAALVEQREMVIRESSELSIQSGQLRDQRQICPALHDLVGDAAAPDPKADPVEALARGAVDLMPRIRSEQMGRKLSALQAYYDSHRIELAARCALSDDTVAPLERLRAVKGERALARHASAHQEAICGALDAAAEACEARQARLKSIREDLDVRHQAISGLPLTAE